MLIVVGHGRAAVPTPRRSAIAAEDNDADISQASAWVLLASLSAGNETAVNGQSRQNL